MRIYDCRLGRFLSVDPLTPQYPWYTPYQFAGNKPIAFVDIDGLEEGKIIPTTKTLIIVIQGYAGFDPEKGKTQVDNNPNDSRDTELGIIKSAKLETQVFTFSSSNTESTKDDVLATINSFNIICPGGKVVMVGHSQGADNIIEFAKENQGIRIDLAITLDIKDAGNTVFSVDDNNIYGNVKNIINYYQEGETVGGEDIDIKDPTRTNGVNVLAPGSNHRSVDNDLLDYIIEDINNFGAGKDAPKMAKDRKLPTADPSATGSDNLPGNSKSKSSQKN